MSEQGIVDRVREIIIEQFGLEPEKVVPEAKFAEDFGLGKLDVLTLAIALEEEYSDISIPDKEVEKWTTVMDVITYLEEAMSK